MIQYKTKFGASWYPGCMAVIESGKKVFLFENEEDDCSKSPFVYEKAMIIDDDKNVIWSGDVENYINRPAVNKGQKIVGDKFIGIGLNPT